MKAKMFGLKVKSFGVRFPLLLGPFNIWGYEILSSFKIIVNITTDESPPAGQRNCLGGEDQRMQFFRCADLDVHNSHFNFLIIPLIVLFVVMACCWRYRRLRRPGPNGNTRVRFVYCCSSRGRDYLSVFECSLTNVWYWSCANLLTDLITPSP